MHLFFVFTIYVNFTHQINRVREPHFSVGLGQTDQGLQLPWEGSNLAAAGTNLNGIFKC